MLLNVFGMLYTFDGWWDNQLQMTMCELVILVFLMVLLITVELVRIDPRALLHKPTDESPFFISMFEDEPRDGDKDFDSAKNKRKRKKKKDKRMKLLGAAPSQVKENALAEVSYYDLTDKKIRCSQLVNIVRTVKGLADINLNNGLDVIIEMQGQTQ